MLSLEKIVSMPAMRLNALALQRSLSRHAGKWSRWGNATARWRSAAKATVGIEEQELRSLPPDEQARFGLARLQATSQVETRVELEAGTAIVLQDDQAL